MVSQSTVNRFGTADYAVFVMTVVISMCIGVYYAFSGRRQMTTSEFIMGNPKMKVLPVAMSLLVTFESSTTLLGMPAEMYVYGVMFWMRQLGFAFLAVFIVKWFLPILHPLGMTSIYEVGVTQFLF